jgi:hypothetical protein
MTTNNIKVLETLGFKSLYIRNVPLGCILNAKTADLYPLINSNAFVHKDNHNIVPAMDNDFYFLVPPQQESKYFEQEIYNGPHSIDDIIMFLQTLKIED